MCGNLIEDNPEYCNNTAPGNWFIVVDASWSNDYSLYEKAKVYYEEQKKIVDQIIEYISKVNGGIANSDDKHEICIILVINERKDKREYWDRQMEKETTTEIQV
uniref:Uncharacterized protein n=1 Tax=Romanomermis culicivorax TaxID=13658 RepID=A0A915IUU5_ROMCU